MRADLDHVGLIVPDLEEAARLFAALGFTMTRRADHTRPTPDRRVEPAGSAQHSIMFGSNYIELQEITGPPGSHLLSAAREKHFGLHILAFGVANADEAHEALSWSRFSIGPVLRWGRPISEVDVSGQAHFAFFSAEYGQEDEGFYCWVEHLTPNLLRSPRLVRHQNGATEIVGLSILADSSASADAISQRLKDAGGMRLSRAAVSFGAVRFDILVAERRHPAPFPLPHVTSLAIGFADTGPIIEAARRLGLPVDDRRRNVAIDLTDHFGIKLRLVEHRPDR